MEYNYKCPKCKNKFMVEKKKCRNPTGFRRRVVRKKISEYNPHEACPKCGEESNRDMEVNYYNGNYVVRCNGFFGKTSS